MTYDIDCAIELIGKLGEHDAHAIDQVVVVLLNAVRLYEGVDPDDVDSQLIDFFPELEIEGSDDAP